MSNQIFPLVENMLDVTARRQQALMSNIANMDTPGFKAKDVLFKEELDSHLALTSSSPSHLSLPGDSSSVRVFETGDAPKDNGNNVDLEHQMTELTKNGLQYVTLVQYLSLKLKTLRASITEGGRG